VPLLSYPYDEVLPCHHCDIISLILKANYQTIAVFLCLYSDNTAQESMKAENAERFGHTLHTSVAKRCAGKFGFDSEPRVTSMTIQEIFPTLLCGKILNNDSFGTDDALGKILQRLKLSSDGRTRYAFVVGSGKQPVGCAAAHLSAKIVLMLVRTFASLFQLNRFPQGKPLC
jgi:hypothetical protein